MLHNTIINFGKYNGQTFKDICLAGNYNYLVYVSSLSGRETAIKTKLREFISFVNSNICTKKEQNTIMYCDMYAPIIRCLNYYQTKRVLVRSVDPSNFVKNITQTLASGQVLAQPVYELVATIAAKTKGRRNSKLFNEAYETFIEIFRSVEVAENKLLDFLHELA